MRYRQKQFPFGALIFRLAQRKAKESKGKQSSAFFSSLYSCRHNKASASFHNFQVLAIHVKIQAPSP